MEREAHRSEPGAAPGDGEAVRLRPDAFGYEPACRCQADPPPAGLVTAMALLIVGFGCGLGVLLLLLLATLIVKIN